MVLVVLSNSSALDRIVDEFARAWYQCFSEIESWCNCESAEFVPDNNVVHDAGLVDGEIIERR